MKLILLIAAFFGTHLFAQTGRNPNILVIVGSNLGYEDLSIYNSNRLNFKTPNIDRLAKSGGFFTNYYAQQSSMAGHAAILTGQNPLRSGFLREGGLPIDFKNETPHLAKLLKSRGYRVHQFGKSMLNEQKDQSPIRHGFDSFYGVLPHSSVDLNLRIYDCKPDLNPSRHCDPKGLLSTERMRDFNEELIERTSAAMASAAQIDRPFFIYHSVVRKSWPDQFSRPYKKLVENSELFVANRVEFDDTVGAILQRLDQLGLVENTIVLVTTDTGVEYVSWGQSLDPANVGERNTYFEARYRVPAVIRWPGVVTPGSRFEGLASHEDWVPTFLAAAHSGPSVNLPAEKIDGYDLKPYLSGKAEDPRRFFFYWAETGDFGGIRFRNHKYEFIEQKESSLPRRPGPIVRLPRWIVVNQGPDANIYALSEHEPGDIYSWFYVRDQEIPHVVEALSIMRDSFDSNTMKSPEMSIERAIENLSEAIAQSKVNK